MGYIGQQITTVFPTSISVDSATVSGAFTSQGIDDNADATAITIDSDENVAIGGTTGITAGGTPSLTVGGGSGNPAINLYGQTSSTIQINFSDATSGTGAYAGYILYGHDDNRMTFGTNAVERIRIDNSGNIMFNSSVYSTADAKLVTTHDGNAQVGFAIRSTSSVAQSEKMIQFKKDNTSGVTEVGTITSNRTSTAYNTSSDYRLKENVSYNFDATTRLKQLKPARFNFKVDADTTVDGFLAHEVQLIVPEAITGTHNEVDDDDNPVYQGIDQSKLVPLLVKSLQEALAEIDTLKTKVSALENK